VLKEPIDTEDVLLRYVYQTQQENLRLIADEIREIGIANNVIFLVFDPSHKTIIG
jgi:hypothetical protein